MINIYKAILLLALFVSNGLISIGFSQEVSVIKVSEAYARETIPGTNISSAYMTLVNATKRNMNIVAASSEVSENIEIHEHTMKDGLMKMRQRDTVEIAANSRVKFQPSGFHLMIFDLKQPLKAGENIIITLYFDDKSQVDINYAIKSIKQKKHHHH